MDDFGKVWKSANFFHSVVNRPKSLVGDRIITLGGNIDPTVCRHKNFPDRSNCQIPQWEMFS